MSRAAAFAQRHGIRLGIQVSPEQLHARLLAELDARGWVQRWPTLVMTGPSHAGIAAAELLVADHASAGWLAAWGACEGRSDVDAHAATVFAALRGRAWFARLADDAVAIAVPGDGLLGLFCIAVAPARRRTGLGRAIVMALRARAPSALPCLQVEARNAPAIALYEQLGFTEAYRYRHQIAPAGAAPSTGDQGTNVWADGGVGAALPAFRAREHSPAPSASGLCCGARPLAALVRRASAAERP